MTRMKADVDSCVRLYNGVFVMHNQLDRSYVRWFTQCARTWIVHRGEEGSKTWRTYTRSGYKLTIVTSRYVTPNTNRWKYDLSYLNYVGLSISLVTVIQLNSITRTRPDPRGLCRRPARTQRSFAAKKVRAGPCGSPTKSARVRSGPCSGI